MHPSCQDSFCFRPEDLQRAMAIQTRKITDSCRDSDCIEDLRVYLTAESQALLEASPGAKVRCAELICASVEVSPVAFNRNQYCVDLTFYYRILADTQSGCCRPGVLCGLATFSKRAVLCGESSAVRRFASDDSLCPCREQMPRAVVEVLEPMVLSSRVMTVCQPEACIPQIPPQIRECFDADLVTGGGAPRLYVTLGQFSVIRLERDAQLIVPVLDYAIPTKECRCDPGCAEDPCEVFSRIPFPADAFAPGGCCPEGNDQS